MQEKQTLSQSPERGGAELIRPGVSLDDVVCQSGAHVMHQQVGEEVDRLATKRDRVRPNFFQWTCRIGGTRCSERWCMAKSTPDRVEQFFAMLRACRHRRWLRSIHEAHELGKHE